MTEDEIRVGRIRSTRLGIEDHGILVFSIDFEFDGCGQGWMSPALTGGGSKERKGWGPGLALIERILEVTEAGAWEKLPGKIVRVKSGGGWHEAITAVGHPFKDLWADDRDYKEKKATA